MADEGAYVPGFDYDVFISYANIDDQPLLAGSPGWIAQFERNLGVRVEQLSGERVNIWRQPDPSGNAEVEEGSAEWELLDACKNPREWCS